MANLTVSLVQMDVNKRDPQSNLAHVQAAVAQAAQRGAQLVVLPELWGGGAARHDVAEFASPLEGGLFAQIAALAQQHGVYIAGSLFESREGHIYNTLALTSPQGVLAGVYRKIHLFPLMDEDRWLSAGKSTLTVDLPWGRTGFAICYDLRFPELLRHYVDSGAELVVLPAQWPHPRLAHFRTLLRARAIENQYVMIAVNRVGRDDDGAHFFGHSCVIDPWGEIVVEAGETVAHLTVTVDLDIVREVREKLPALRDRRLK